MHVAEAVADKVTHSTLYRTARSQALVQVRTEAVRTKDTYFRLGRADDRPQN